MHTLIPIANMMSQDYKIKSKQNKQLQPLTGAQVLRGGFASLEMSDITPIWLDNLQCSGTEQSLIDCRHNGIGIHNCRHGVKDAGIVCQQGMASYT